MKPAMQPTEKTSLKISYALLINQGLFSATSTIAFAITSIVIVTLTGENEQWTGVPSTVVMVGAALVAYPIGWLIDRAGYRLGLTLGYLFGLVGTLVAGYAVTQRSLWLLLIGVFSLGLARGVVNLGRYAAADASPPQQRAKAISMVVLGGTVGSIFGPALIAWTTSVAIQFGLTDTITPSISGFSGPLFFGTACFVVAVLVGLFFLHPDPQTIAQQYYAQGNQDGVTGSGRSFREALGDPDIRLAVGAMIFGQVSMVLVMVVTPVYMRTRPEAVADISIVIMAHTFGMFGLSFVTGWLVERLTAPLVIALGCLTLAIACITAPLSDNVYWLVMALFLLGLGWNFCFVAGSTMLSAALQPNEKGRIQALVDALANLASGTGTLSSGFLFAYFGFFTLSWLTVAITLPPALQLALRQRARRKAVTPSRL